jgi:hypothetical protein
MLSIEDFENLAPGDVLEVGSAFKPLTSEPVLFRVNERVGDTIRFDMVLFGVNLGPAECARTEGEELVWAVA